MDMHGGMSMAPKSSSTNGTMMGGHKMRGMMMHMTFFWGKDTLILFDGFPSHNTAYYVLALFMVFTMSILIEFISHTRFIKPDTNPMVARLLHTLLHVLRMGLAYLVMLALMSFNAGVFLVAVLGHALGFFFFFFSSRSFKEPHQRFDLPPMAC
ncbi:copper transporter 1-like [Trifolium medium]|uniref:Copper transport protein n=1 Tax=Trifolium medium TaxID=97028 RepID=A0A392PP54_9FABA|nr:copper transporter 1-like [Trifolium medium]